MNDMNVKLVGKPKERIVSAKDMVDGQIGVIHSWHRENVSYNGRIVQASYNDLVSLGCGYGSSWSNRHDLPDDCLVRLLEPGEQIEIVAN